MGGSELTQITNREGVLDGLALRPEMTPTVTRMVSKIWKEVDKPVKWFSIANFYRNEKPQKGRNREFWQLNCDIFGHNGFESDIEILTLGLDLMLAFDPPKESFTLNLNHRALLDSFFSGVTEQKVELFRILDKYEKLPKDIFTEKLEVLGLSPESIEKVFVLMQAISLEDLEKKYPEFLENEHYVYLKDIFEKLSELWYWEFVKFSGSLIRGFDYYDGVIFEVFDNNPDNPRALFWGWRYNGLAEIFGVKEDIPAIGFAPGDETMKLFLEGHGLLEKIQNMQSEKYYLPLLDGVEFTEIAKIANILRLEWKHVNLGLSLKKLPKALKYANKNHYTHVVIFGEQEQERGEYILKDLRTGEEESVVL